MICPGCSAHRTLELESLPEGLRVRRCPACGGRWLRSDDYWRWRTGRQREAAPPEAFPSDVSGEPEPPKLRFCPEDGYLLARFQVGPPHSFALDQCRTCSGVWLDAGEWEALAAGGLADRLHLILSEEWQDQLRPAGRAATEERQWARQLGEADLARITEIKAWLDGHPKRSQLYAYLRFHERAV